ncbi:peptidylprolyl isomerase [Serratia proteamaculans]|uniref:FKBP-type peptidyl-prolyl cis-trans isomerase N-terminal domain-containing protein n=1 Tax=Serratia proteamaculans TaxID=28151 RepID=UPI0015770663|nr:FKBP-type peptidyl-prolyl cis-trans isomerase N-terminal domain-containing protein [Serratia proteamaculans]NTX77619.1 peptidylprolyl isomerase [Serratia proteamaculans]NTZ28138.1 peptidylprolyl isomerase [Serratia proteamaculans]
MKRYHPLSAAVLLALLCGSLPCALGQEAAATQSGGIPALLQFAERYQAAPPPVSPQQREREKKKQADEEQARQAQALSAKRQQQRLQEKETQAQQQQAQLNQLRQQNAALQAEQQRAAQAAPDLTPLLQLTQGLSRAWHGTPDELQLRQRLAQQQQQWQQKYDALLERAGPLAQPLVLNSPQASQSYAAGVALGKDILLLQAERQNWGVTTDKNQVLAGVVDAFSGDYQLPQPALEQALQVSEQQVNQARQRMVKTQAQRGQQFMAAFQKQKGAVQAESGFWYRIEAAGNGAIPPDAVVTVVVKETLTDGTVIQDMEASGARLSQPLAAYPPLFREAIGQLKNHGTIMLVVPPEMAYGDKGYAPKVPPGATMVYTLRVADVTAAG